jgi:uncharacterized protein
MRAASVQIAALYYYPVKSAGGIELAQARLTCAGFVDDRRWMLVSTAGRFMTQREWPRLALLRPTLSEEALHLQAPSVPPLSIALSHQGERRRVQIWKDHCDAFDEGDDAASWLSGLLQVECRLVRFDPAQRRLSPRSWTGKHEAENRFSDAFPLLLLGAASLADLNRRLAAPLPVNRFRPNVLLEGLQPYDEDDIAELYGDGIRLRLVKPCTRCKITTTSQQTGESAGDEPLRTLRSYRYDPRLRGVRFAQNGIIVQGVGRTLRRGQRLQVRWREPRRRAAPALLAGAASRRRSYSTRLSLTPNRRDTRRAMMLRNSTNIVISNAPAQARDCQLG